MNNMSSSGSNHGEIHMNVDDMIIFVAYFSIPVQILVSLWQFPRLAKMPVPIIILLVLFAFFIFLCGAGHLLRCLGRADTDAYRMLNWATALISLTTALYLLPLVPSLLTSLDDSLQELIKLNKESEESRKKLFTFMAFLCHEIRNPLFAISSSATILLEDQDDDTRLSEEQQTAAGSIMDSSVLMMRIVNDVLDISKIDAGKLQLEEKVFDLHRLFDHLGHSISLQVQQVHGHTEAVAFGLTVAPQVPQWVQGDSTRLLQIVYNLLSNSIKFTSQGRIDVLVTVSNQDHDETTEIENDPAQQDEEPRGFRDARQATTPSSTTISIRGHDFSRVSEPALSSASDFLDSSTNIQKSSQENNDMFSMALLDAAEEGLSSSSTHKRGRMSRNNSIQLHKNSNAKNDYKYNAIGIATLDATESSGAGMDASDYDDDEEESMHGDTAMSDSSMIYLRIEVRDTGIGIESDHLDNIFEPYTQAKLNTYRKHGGTGLGLSIISGLTKAMGGTIDATSTLDAGSSFVVHMPLTVVEQPPEDLTNLNSVHGREEDLLSPAPFPQPACQGDGYASQVLQDTMMMLSNSSIGAELLPSDRGATASAPQESTPPRTSQQDNSLRLSQKHKWHVLHRQPPTAATGDTLPDHTGIRFPTTQAALGDVSPFPSSDSIKQQHDEDPFCPERTPVASSGGQQDCNSNGVESTLSSPLDAPLTKTSGTPLFPVNVGKTAPTTATAEVSTDNTTVVSAVRNTSDSNRGSRSNNKMEKFVFPDENTNVALIVDDNQLNQKILAKMLSHFGVHYRVASNGKEAVDMVLEQSRHKHPGDPTVPQYGLVLMDLSMPIMDGFEATEELRKNGVTIPIITLTANALSSERDRSFAVGSTQFCTKPIMRKDLHKLCKQYLTTEEK